MRKEEERRSFEEEIRCFRTKLAKAEEALSQARNDIQALKQSSRVEDFYALEESSWLLYEEVQKCRKSAEHARKQSVQVVRGNKGPIAMYKDAIASRDKNNEQYKAAMHSEGSGIFHPIGNVKIERPANPMVAIFECSC